jgi:hypothetical protein
MRNVMISRPNIPPPSHIKTFLRYINPNPALTHFLKLPLCPKAFRDRSAIEHQIGVAMNKRKAVEAPFSQEILEDA